MLFLCSFIAPLLKHLRLDRRTLSFGSAHLYPIMVIYITLSLWDGIRLCFLPDANSLYVCVGSHPP